MPDYFTDDVKMISDLLRDNWSLGPGDTPEFVYEPESFIVNARLGAVYTYQLTRSNALASSNYDGMTRNSYVSVRLSNRDRAIHFRHGNEVYRILHAYRRAGPTQLNGYSWLQVNSDRPAQDASGWYVTNFEINLTCPVRGFDSPGFGRLDDCPDIYLATGSERDSRVFDCVRTPIPDEGSDRDCLEG